MATSLTSRVQASITWNLINNLTGYTQPPAATSSWSYDSATLTQGTGAAGTANLIYAVQVVIAASGNTTVNINGTPVTDAFGNTVVMARLKFIFVSNTNLTTASSITVGNATNPINLFSAATSTVSIRNNGIFLLGDPGATGIPVTGAASDTLKILNADGSNSATVNLAMIGSTA